MLPGNIEYFRPNSIMEAVELFKELQQEKKQPMYYSGGTEILTLGRLDLIVTDAIIDLKGIAECFILQKNEQFLLSGAAIPLTVLEEQNPFPLLTEVSKEIADRTARNKITLGGNICGKIFYREAILPFLLADSHLIIAGDRGLEEVPIHTVFNQTLRLTKGQFLVQIATDVTVLNAPFMTKKKRQQWETGYPLITGAAIKKDGQLRIAFSGVCPFPFRSLEMEQEMNNSALPFEDRISRALRFIPGPVLNDIEGSKEYRLFVMQNLLMDFLKELEGK